MLYSPAFVASRCCCLPRVDVRLPCRACRLTSRDWRWIGAAFAQQYPLTLGFGAESPDSSAVFFVRHWGVLIFVVAGLIVYSAYAPGNSHSRLGSCRRRKIRYGVSGLFRASETDECDDRYRNLGRQLCHPLRCVSCRTVRLLIQQKPRALARMFPLSVPSHRNQAASTTSQRARAGFR